MQPSTDSAGRDTIPVALAAMTDQELGALQMAAETGPQLAPGLLAFLAHACDWELARRAGRHFMLNGPHAAIDPEEMPITFAALAALIAGFHDNRRVVALLVAVGEVLKEPPPSTH